ncbi:Methionyl-tRNA formyltransferase [Tilletia horrida]|uniref:Methionyl-tRNA formyltransferase n=1 Tax=Tilletia horrida TaxID=155126 RepID=A0AAN6GS88_9BASI|nr:Methionyl-tRNA formyltransferase [Tilletia horrida]KAK0555328.1 Methionyl-tRNA formyltransferase [Tilletia horrida]KAK0568522.1 Methionyl-tRNA formyltransferase [Tilletia horrida]
MLWQQQARSWAIRLERHCRAEPCSRRRYTTTASPSAATAQKPSPPPYDILFCGSDDFSCASLNAIHRRKDLWKSLTVLHPPATEQKWGAKRMSVAPVQTLAQELGLDHIEVPRSGLDDWKLRGAAPLQWAIARRLTETGITVQSLSRGAFDHGRILAQIPYKIGKGRTYESLMRAVAPEGAKLLTNTLAQLPEHVAQARDQTGEPTYAPKLKRDFMRIRWDRWTAADIEARHRGMGYLYPVHSDLFTHSNPAAKQICTHFVNVSIFTKNNSPLAEKTKAFLADRDILPGCARYAREAGGLLIRCAGSSVLLARTLQVQSKKRQTAREWIIGYTDRGDANKILRFGNHSEQTIKIGN